MYEAGVCYAVEFAAAGKSCLSVDVWRISKAFRVDPGFIGQLVREM